ncbi:AI-2E family transporter [Mangrovimonas xylaniphaga]|uniref:AI-2E family transporter n=1 Tax=Mangrovimonas xylaniphaga TaxID=1645915 RepID=UPI0006B6642A|nr:AI-2E family transporter [Mangrovimonas xylaniphaga]
MKQIPPSVIRQVFLLILITFIAYLICLEMIPYLTGVLGAITIYFLFQKWMTYLVKVKRWGVNAAAIFLMFLSFLIILVPVAGIIWMLGNKIGHAVDNSTEVINAFKEQFGKVESYVGFDINSQIDTTKITSWLSENLQAFAGGTFNAVIAVGIMYFMLYYMLTNRRELGTSLNKYVPMNKEGLVEVGKEIKAMVRSNALGIPLVAIAQGIVALIGFLIFGVESPFFWFVITIIGSMIPFVGTLVGILPVFLITLSAGHTVQAWGILIYGFVIVGSTDNIIRLFILKKLDNVHPLITLVGVIVGVPLFGFIGLIFGPLLISLFLILIKTYKAQYGAKDPMEWHHLHQENE